MSNHIFVIMLATALMAGVGSFTYTGQIYRKYKAEYLKSLRMYLLFYNIFNLTLFVYHYLSVNVFDRNTNILMNYWAFFIIILGAIFISASFYTFYFYKTVAMMKEKSISKTVRTAFGVWVLGFAGMFMVLIISNWDQSPGTRWFNWFFLWLFSVMLIILNIIVLNLFEAWKTRQTKNAFKPFLYMFLMGYAASFLDITNDRFINASYLKLLTPLCFLYINLTPLFWIKYFLLRQSSDYLVPESGKANLEEICRKFKITGREKEIIQQILLGKNNNEISDALFISLNTVKTYISKIFQKLNVKSRSQLIHFINSYSS